MILAEQQRLPVGFMDAILEARYYARAKAMVDAADTKEKRDALPDDPLVNQVKVIRMELAREERARKQSENDAG